MRTLLVGSLIAAAAVVHADTGETVVFDATGDTPPAATEPAQADQAALVKRFPDAHARKHCQPDLQTPGTLLPRITTLTAAVTRAGAAQQVFLIDYCPSGVAAPRTRRLIVLDGTTPALDRELPASLPADEVLAAVDLDHDGLAELVMTGSAYREHRMIETVYVVRPTTTKGLTALGSWLGIEHCSVDAGENQVLHRIAATDGHTFQHTKVTRKCWYPPAPPP